MPSIKERVIKLIADELSISTNQIHPDSHIMESLGADSLDIIEIKLDLEKEFKINIPDTDIESIFGRTTVPVDPSSYPLSATIQEIAGHISKILKKQRITA